MGNVVFKVWAYSTAFWERVFGARSAHVHTSIASSRQFTPCGDAVSASLGLCRSRGCRPGVRALDPCGSGRLVSGSREGHVPGTTRRAHPSPSPCSCGVGPAGPRGALGLSPGQRRCSVRPGAGVQAAGVECTFTIRLLIVVSIVILRLR